MEKTNHHGRHSFFGRNRLCSIKHWNQEKVGKFGRIFREGFSPLYTSAHELNEIGKQGGIMDGGENDRVTERVPLGMVFFGQFIDHDITFDTTSSLNSVNNPGDIENFRTPRLDLDCVFGSGPEDQPYLYEGGRDKNKFKLLTGESNNNIGQGVALEKYDLARNGKGTALIGDPRNDENRVISQLQLLIIKFYNKVYETIIADHPSYAAKEIYEEARKITSWHYQWLALHTFLGHICGPVVVKDILSNGRKYYKPCNEAFIPVEFSVAAYRFGHSMIRQKMKLKVEGEIIDIFSKEFGRGFTPLSSIDQVIDWELFFDVGNQFQKAAQCDIHLPSSLLALPFIPEPENSLAARNLKRGNSFLLPSGESIARAMGRSEEEIKSIQECLDRDCDTPLWLYILAEAQIVGRQDKINVYTQREGLGPIGARIVAEALIGLLQLDSNSFLGNNPNWLPTLGENGEFRFKHLLDIVFAPDPV